MLILPEIILLLLLQLAFSQPAVDEGKQVPEHLPTFSTTQRATTSIWFKIDCYEEDLCTESCFRPHGYDYLDCLT
jgi:hypothetical protein